MPINSREKGARFERKLAAMLRKYGYDTRRSVQYCGRSGEAADIVNLPYIHIEAKHQEKMQLYPWMDQAKRDAAANGGIPAVFHKKNNANILVTLEFEDFMRIYEEYERAVSGRGQADTDNEGYWLP